MKQTTLEEIPRVGALELNINIRANLNISAYAARQKVNTFVLEEVSYLMHAVEPILILDKRICWRVPIFLSLPSQGDVGEVGVIDVDIETGQMHITPQLIQELESRAEFLALHSTSTPTVS